MAYVQNYNPLDDTTETGVNNTPPTNSTSTSLDPGKLFTPLQNYLSTQPTPLGASPTQTAPTTSGVSGSTGLSVPGMARPNQQASINPEPAPVPMQQRATIQPEPTPIPIAQPDKAFMAAPAPTPTQGVQPRKAFMAAPAPTQPVRNTTWPTANKPAPMPVQAPRATSWPGANTPLPVPGSAAPRQNMWPTANTPLPVPMSGRIGGWPVAPVNSAATESAAAMNARLAGKSNDAALARWNEAVNQSNNLRALGNRDAAGYNPSIQHSHTPLWQTLAQQYLSSQLW